MTSQTDWFQALASISTLCAVAFTALMALATIYLALETRALRTRAEAQRKHVAFRAAMLEIAGNVSNLHGWYPNLEPTPSHFWRSQRLAFDSLTDLMSLVLIHPQVWQRAIALMRNLKAAEALLKGELVDKDLERAKVFFYRIDIYLKQLARYIAAEMRRHGFPHEEASALLGSPLLRPARWAYGDTDLPPETIAAGMESQPISPLSALPPEPRDPAFADCTLAKLIQEAHSSAMKPFGPEEFRAI